MARNELKIGDRHISENLEIRTNVKTLLWIAIGLFSALMAIFTLFYFDMRSRDRATNEKMQNLKKEIHQSVTNALKEELRIYQDRQIKVIKEIGDIRGDIKVILDRTRNYNESNYNINNAPAPASIRPPIETFPTDIDEGL